MNCIVSMCNNVVYKFPKIFSENSNVFKAVETEEQCNQIISSYIMRRTDIKMQDRVNTKHILQ